MNPEIEKFWTKLGYTIETDVMVGPGSAEIPFRLFWFIHDKSGKQLRCVGQSDPYDRDSEAYQQLEENPPCTVYYFDGNLYSEEQMLKIVKMKAFA